MNNHLHIVTYYHKNGILFHRDMKRGRMIDFCSTKMDSQKVILKGEYDNPESRTCYVRIFEYDESSPVAFLKTTHTIYIHSIKIISHNRKEFILVSGNGDCLDIFTYNSTISSKFIGNIYTV